MGRPSEQCDNFGIYFGPISSKSTVDLSKIENPGTNIDFAIFKIVWWILWRIF